MDGHQTSKNVSFGVEFDDDPLFAVAQLEKDCSIGKDSIKPISHEVTDDAACTWNTPLHVLTPVEICYKAEEKKQMKASTAQDSETVATVDSTKTPRTLGPKPKVFEVILSESEIADHMEEHSDLAERNNSHLDNTEIARNPNNSATTLQHGESVLVCKPNEWMAAVALANSELPPVSSCLFHGNSAESLSSSMKLAILKIIVNKVASTPQEVEMYAQCTLLAASLASESAAAVPTAPVPVVDKLNAVKLCVDYLEENEFILRRITTNSGIETETFEPTQLGSALVASGLSPDEGLLVFVELQKARRCFVLENELHTVYLVTPIYIQDQWPNIDWMQYLCLWEKLPVDMKRVAELVDVQERFLTCAVRSGGNAQGQNAAQLRMAAIHRRFYAAMALHDLANEMPLPAVVKKYGCTRGLLQSLQQSAATFAGMVTVFCARLGWYNLELLLTQFQSRFSFGVQRELVDLVRVSLLNAQRARAIFNAGYQTVAALASAEPAALELVVIRAAPFLSMKKAEDEDDWELAERSKSQCIWVSGLEGLTEYEAAVLLIQEAKKCVAEDLLEMGIEWKPQTATAFANPGTMPDGNGGMSEGGCLMTSLPSVPNGCSNLPIRPLAAVPGPGLTAQQQQKIQSQQQLQQQQQEFDDKFAGQVEFWATFRSKCRVLINNCQVTATPCCTPRNLHLQSTPTMTEFLASAGDGSDSASCGAELLMRRSEAFLHQVEHLIREMDLHQRMYASDVTDVNTQDVEKAREFIESHLRLNADEADLSAVTHDAGKLVLKDIKHLVSFGRPASVNGVARSACEAIERLLDVLKTKHRQMFEIWLKRYIKLQRCLHFSRINQIQSLKKTHSDERTHVCSQCTKAFKTRQQLDRHQLALHMHERPWPCTVCDREFAQPGNLRIHMRTHTGERPYTCAACRANFAHSGSLKGHMATHRNVDNVVT